MKRFLVNCLDFVRYDVPYGVRNLVNYFPIIWKDRDWDYHFWLELNIKKLERMERSFREHGNHVDSERDADNVRNVRRALQRVLDDAYLTTVLRPHEEKWGKPEMISTPCRFDDKGKPTLHSVTFTHDKVTNEEKAKLERREYRRLIKHADYLKQQDLDYAMNQVKKHLFAWWN
jgi:hypothetical protein